MGRRGRAPGEVISLADEEAVKQVLVDNMTGLRGLVNDLMRLRDPRRRSATAARRRQR